MTTARRPWLAAVFSLLLSGLGHVYVGRPGLGAVADLLGLLTITLMYVGALFIPLAPLNVALPFLMLPVVWLGVPIHAALLARRTDRNYALRPYNRWYVYASLYLVLGVLVLPELPALLRTHIVEALPDPQRSDGADHANRRFPLRSQVAFGSTPTAARPGGRV